MRILMVAPVFPFPRNSGGRIRIYQTLKGMAASHDVTFVALTDQSVEALDLAEAQSLCEALHVVRNEGTQREAVFRAVLRGEYYRVARFRSSAMQEVLDSILMEECFDVVWVHFLNMASYVRGARTGDATMILDQHNVDEWVWEKYMMTGWLPARAFAWKNLGNLKRFQAAALPQFSVILSVSQQERDHMAQLVGDPSSVWLVPNGVDTGFFRCAGDEREREAIILFCASMDVRMNEDAAVRFAREVFPLVRSRVSAAQFILVGRNPGKRVQQLAAVEGVTVTGTVDDVRPYYQNAKVVVAPFRYGAGTKLKILEAMAMGVPVVSTTVGCQGIGAVPDRHLLVGDEDEALAGLVARLLQDRSLAKNLAVAARSHVEAHYSWDSIINDVDRKLTKFRTERRGS